ncbi:MAG: PadR family transcriptional regulator [Chloroflexota bacterium]|nr:PadR family transcriptional regulator [Chloroflexota bacterium]
MARHGAGLLPAAYALLGLLAAGAAHGYDLHRPFAAGGTLRAVCRLPLNQHYALLKQLQARGLVEAGDLETAGVTPPRRPLAITPAGRAVLTAWLAQPVPHTRDVRLEFLLKLYFAERQAPATVPALLAAQVAVTRDSLARLDSEWIALADRAPGDFARRVVDMRLRQNRAVLDWLEDAQRAQAA